MRRSCELAIVALCLAGCGDSPTSHAVLEGVYGFVAHRVADCTAAPVLTEPDSRILFIASPDNGYEFLTCYSRDLDACQSRAVFTDSTDEATWSFRKDTFSPPSVPPMCAFGRFEGTATLVGETILVELTAYSAAFPEGSRQCSEPMESDYDLLPCRSVDQWEGLRLKPPY